MIRLSRETGYKIVYLINFFYISIMCQPCSGSWDYSIEQSRQKSLL